MNLDRAGAVQAVAYAALDALESTLPLDLCAYLHVGEDDGPQLYLRSPELGSMTATQAFDVFTSLRDAVEGGAGEDPTDTMIGRFRAIVVHTRGPRSAGVFVAGRDGMELDAAQQSTVTAISRAFGTGIHLVEASVGRTFEPVVQRVAVSLGDQAVSAEVTIGPDAASVGSATAPTTSEAVALAAIDAVAPEHKLLGVAEVDVDQDHAVVVLVQAPDGATGLGAASVGGDVVRATATAAIRSTLR